MLCAILCGAWIVDEAWLLRSVEHGKLLPELPHEATDLFRGCAAARAMREAADAPRPLVGLKVHVADPGEADARERTRLLAAAAGAHVLPTPRGAAIVVGGRGGARSRRGGAAVAVLEEWLYDSISACEAADAHAYRAATEKSS